ncbi:hypothetical protein L7F22_040299 [Adiantum nelumboides]|nr:hypothetical protein [Adiantum nelumboides]
MAPVQYVSFIPSNKTNVMGTLNMLGLAKRIRAPFLLTSTNEAYCDPLEHPQSEFDGFDSIPMQVTGVVTKKGRGLQNPNHGLSYRSKSSYSPYNRIFNTYGPRMCIDNRRVVSTFVAQGLIWLMESKHIGPFNLGNLGEFTMLELANAVKEVIDPQPTPKRIEEATRTKTAVVEAVLSPPQLVPLQRIRVCRASSQRDRD